MKGIIYVSQAETVFDDQAIAELADKAAARNEELGVTGYLFFAAGQFLQYIEGEHETVADLMDRIERDKRHTVLQSLHDDDLTQRRFPSWQMRWLRSVQFVGFEILLSDHLMLMKSFSGDTEFGRETVWRMVDRMADAQTRFASKSA